MAKLKINRGTTYTIGFQYNKNGEGASLVGCTVRFTIKDVEWDTNTTDATAEVVKNITTGDANGAATITLDPVDTATMTPGKYYYDIKVQEVGGQIYKVDEGTITLDGSPTNRLS